MNTLIIIGVLLLGVVIGLVLAPFMIALAMYDEHKKLES